MRDRAYSIAQCGECLQGALLRDATDLRQRSRANDGTNVEEKIMRIASPRRKISLTSGGPKIARVATGAVLSFAILSHVTTPAVAQEREQWLVRDGVPSFALPIPRGFMRQNAEGAAIAAYGHPGRRTVMLIFDAGDPIVQGRLTLGTEQAASLRASDTILFEDRPQTYQVGSFVVPGFAGRTEQGQSTVLRWIAVLPTQERAVAVQMVAPLEYEGEMKAAFVQMLQRTKTRTHWRTPFELRVERVSSLGFLSFFALSITYGSLWLARWRKAKSQTIGERENQARAMLLALLGLALALHATWWLLRPTWDVRLLGIGFILFAAKQGLNAVRLWRKLPETPTETPS